jgi:hypothetical protein
MKARMIQVLDVTATLALIAVAVALPILFLLKLL